MRLETYLITDRGLVRERNEDRCGAFAPEDAALLAERGELFVVADGVGGYAGGDVAADLAVRTVPEVYYADDWPGAAEKLAAALVSANAAIRERARVVAPGQPMGATAVVTAIVGDAAVIGAVGDCRVYLLRDGEARRLTVDQSWIEEQVRQGLLTPEQARTHPRRNWITHALGIERELSPALVEADLQAGDIVLLCSDGLWGMVEDADLATASRSGADAGTMARALVDLALARGGTDNIAVVLVRVLDGD